ncbi:hypothetical protein PMI40_00222, partial [Herbaspirillum sp. YR522]
MDFSRQPVSRTVWHTVLLCLALAVSMAAAAA